MALRRVLGGLAVVLTMLTIAGQAGAGGGSPMTLSGTVESAGHGLEGYEVALHLRFLGPFGRGEVVGRAVTGPFGEFRIDYDLPHWLPPWLQPMLFLRAERSSAMLASALGQAPVEGPVVVNERTTVATGFAFAQFVKESGVDGNRYGMLNAARMAANLVHPETGTVAAVLRLPPNGPETEALATFNALANIVAACTAEESGCAALSKRPPRRAGRRRRTSCRRSPTSPATRGSTSRSCSNCPSSNRSISPRWMSCRPPGRCF